ncbi:acyl-CoA N-acyltransferase [Colletotrichum navitas]|uniref:Acyl-CoA N-acyltransferase n=1 Tax=Colletotrichum navitas TaxID=681940 RepID=A0AAD8Q7B1_9PEZI|nr:acyl-CoA N-acyltransferase [Colletotrichum navitas]KAK1596517.1 acyl-CoA N-acyltransferase [Colletotrichum navitas]
MRNPPPTATTSSIDLVVEYATLEDAPAVADIFLKSFNSDFFQTLFPQNEYGRDYMTKASEQFMLSKQNGSQEGQVFVVRNEQGMPVAASVIWIIRPEDEGTWSWRKRWPTANAGQRDDLLDEFFTGMATQHHRIMGKEPHIYFELIMTDPAYRRRGYGLALLQKASEIADQKGYPIYLDAEEYIVQLYNLAGYAIKTDLGQTSALVPMVRPAKS